MSARVPAGSWTLPGFVAIDDGAWTVTTSRHAVVIWHHHALLESDASPEQCWAARELVRQRDAVGAGWYDVTEGPDAYTLSRARWDLSEIGATVDPKLFVDALSALPFEVKWKEVQVARAPETDSLVLVGGLDWLAGIAQLRTPVREARSVIPELLAVPPDMYTRLYWQRVVDHFQLAPGSRFHGSILRDVIIADGAATTLLTELVAAGIVEAQERAPTASQAALFGVATGNGESENRKRARLYPDKPWGPSNCEHHWYRWRA